MSQTVATPQEKPPPRPPSTVNGLVASMIVCVLIVLVFVGIRALTSTPLNVKPSNQPYRDTVSEAQQGMYTLAYPSVLPTGWLDNSLDFEPGTHPTWQLGLLTETGTFVGLVQAGESVQDLLATYVNGTPTKGAVVSVTSSVANAGTPPVPTTWTSYDAGSDHAYATTFHGEALVVYGSASTADLQQLMGLLTSEPVAEARQSTSPSDVPSASPSS